VTVFNIDLDLTEEDVLLLEYLAINKSEDPDFGALYVQLWDLIEPDVPYYPVLGDFVQVDVGTTGTWKNLGSGTPLLRVDGVDTITNIITVTDGAGILYRFDATLDAFRLDERVSYTSPNYNGTGDTYFVDSPLTLDAIYLTEDIDDGSGWYLAGDEG
jgi:hypothetical protein